MPAEQEIKQVAITEILNFVSNSVKSALITIDGVDQPHPIWKTRITDGTVRKYVQLDGDVQGRITKGALIDAQGRIWFEKDFDHAKGQDGYTLVFPFRQTIGKIEDIDRINQEAIR